MPVPRCVNCSLALKHPLPYRQVTEASDAMLSILSSWINPTTVTEDDKLCQECFFILQNESITFSTGAEVARAFGHPQVCLICGKSIMRARTHQVPENSSERNVMISCIPVHQINRLERVCLRCWTNVYKSLRRHALVDQNRQENVLEEAAMSHEDLDASMSSLKSLTESPIPVPPPLPTSQPYVYTGVADEPSVPGPHCSECSKAITGFVFVCVQCATRACGACDARGLHARHYVLRAPAGSAEEELQKVFIKVREAISSSVLELSQPPRAQPESKEPTDESDDNSCGDYEIKTEIKLEVDVDEDDPLGSEYEELSSVPDTSGSQVVPEPTEVKKEQPDPSAALSRESASSHLPSPSPPSPSPSADSEDSQPLAKRRHVSSHSSNQTVTFPTHAPKTNTNMEVYKRKLASDPNADPGSPSVAGSLNRLKK